MLNRLWPSFFLVAFFSCILQWLWLQDASGFQNTIDSIFDMAKLSVEISIGLVGILAFWLGVMAIAQAAGVVDIIAKIVAPVLHKLMPDVPKDHPAMGFMSLNVAANVFSLDNAATPFGIKAMESLQKLNPMNDTASNAQIMFLVLNTTAVTLFPVTIFMYRAQMGSSQPMNVFLPLILATACSTFAGVVATLFVQKRLKAVYKTLLLAAGLIIVCFGLFSVSNIEKSLNQDLLNSLTNGILLCFLAWVMWRGLHQKVAVYDEFIEGAKQGFELAIKIIPYLVAMLTAIGALRGSGVMDLLNNSLRFVVEKVGYPSDFIDVIAVAIMKPFSGSGSRALMIDAFNQYGVDSIQGQIASIMQGSTETTFYVLSVYFGAVGIKKIRHALGVGLFGDLVGATAAIIIGYVFFG